MSRPLTPEPLYYIPTMLIFVIVNRRFTMKIFALGPASLYKYLLCLERGFQGKYRDEV